MNRDVPYNGILHFVDKVAYLAIGLTAVRSVTAGKVRRQVGLPSKVLKIDLVTADGREERSHTRACREFASTKFVNRLNTGFAIC